MLIRFENHSTCSILLLSAWVVRSVIENSHSSAPSKAASNSSLGRVLFERGYLAFWHDKAAGVGCCSSEVSYRSVC